MKNSDTGQRHLMEVNSRGSRTVTCALQVHQTRQPVQRMDSVNMSEGVALKTVDVERVKSCRIVEKA